MIIQSSLSILKGLVQGPPWIPNFNKKVQYLHITYVQPPIYFKSSTDYLQDLVQYKCYIIV